MSRGAPAPRKPQSSQAQSFVEARCVRQAQKSNPWVQREVGFGHTTRFPKQMRHVNQATFFFSRSPSLFHNHACTHKTHKQKKGVEDTGESSQTLLLMSFASFPNTFLLPFSLALPPPLPPLPTQPSFPPIPTAGAARSTWRLLPCSKPRCRAPRCQ